MSRKPKPPKAKVPPGGPFTVCEKCGIGVNIDCSHDCRPILDPPGRK